MWLFLPRIIVRKLRNKLGRGGKTQLFIGIANSMGLFNISILLTEVEM